MSRSEETGDLAKALAGAQGEFPKLVKEEVADAGSYKYTYASLPAVISVCQPILTAWELAVTQTMHADANGPSLRTMLMHSSGQWVAGFYPMTAYPNPQQMGSAITYARRYSYCAILGIAPDEDDDGAAAGDAPQQPEAPPPEEVPPLTKDDIRFVADQLWENERDLIDAWGAENEVPPPQLVEELHSHIEVNFSQTRMTRRDLYKQVRAELSR